jgi:serine protease Do
MKRQSRAASRFLALLLVALAIRGAQSQDRLRDHLTRPLLTAFREVITEPAKSTVQVYCDGFRACLGAVVRSDGYIVTKNSELKGKIECQLNNETQKREAKIVARDEMTDLAILKVDAKNMPVVPWSAEDPPAVGSWLATTGLSQLPISIGVVSVAARKIAPPKAALGITLDIAENMARIASLAPGMAAEKAGLKAGDIIRKVSGEDIKSRPQLQQSIGGRRPGEKVTLVIERDGRLQTIDATLGNMSDLMHDERSDFQNSLGGSLSERRTGFPLALQHDSVLRPSECGGPIVDLDGKVVGLNIARAGRVESYALTASVVRDSVEKMLKTELTSTSADDKFFGQKGNSGPER